MGLGRSVGGRLVQQPARSLTLAVATGASPFLNAKTNGAAGDGRRAFDAVMTSGSPAITSTEAAFTQADVGSNIAVKGAASGGNILFTTILSVTDASHATLSANCTNGGVSANEVFIYKTNDQAAIQSLLDGLRTTGGTVVVSHGIFVVGQHPTKTDRCLDLPARVQLIVDAGAEIRAADNLPAGTLAVVRTDLKSGWGALTASSDITPYTDSGATISGTGIISGGMKNTALQYLVELQTALGPWLEAYGTGVIGSGQFHRVEDVQLFGDGAVNVIALHFGSGAACNFVDNIEVFNCSGGGIIDDGSDNNVNNCIVGGAPTRDGIRLGANSKASNCKIYGSGGSGSYAMRMAAGCTATSIEIQECAADGVLMAGSGSKFDGAINCNGSAVVFSGDGNYFEATLYGQNLGSGPYTPATGVTYSGTRTGNVAIAKPTAAAAASIVNWITGDPTNNRTVFDRQGDGSSQAIAYAAAITPDPYGGDMVLVGTLTGIITINNPNHGGGHKGSRLTFLLTQDGTGGRTVTWGANYKTTGAISTALNSVTAIDFVHDGTNWREVSRSVT